MYKILFYPPLNSCLILSNRPILFLYNFNKNACTVLFQNTFITKITNKKDTIFNNRICKSNLNGNILYAY